MIRTVFLATIYIVIRNKMECLLCGKDSKRDNFCRECKEKKQNATAIVSQNKKKLRKLLQESEITLERFEKFIVYSNNIVKY